MATNIFAARKSAIPNASERGYHIMYREQETNHCPGCGRTHWFIGRTLAECAFCQTALPLESSAMAGGSQIVRTVRRPPVREHEHAFAA